MKKIKFKKIKKIGNYALSIKFLRQSLRKNEKIKKNDQKLITKNFQTQKIISRKYNEVNIKNKNQILFQLVKKKIQTKKIKTRVDYLIFITRIKPTLLAARKLIREKKVLINNKIASDYYKELYKGDIVTVKNNVNNFLKNKFFIEVNNKKLEYQLPINIELSYSTQTFVVCFLIYNNGTKNQYIF